ncbi:uncharacterized protein Z518_06896 [Rhinocladiella mackenziei CBS 650.93]|uniref:ABM domain-containing protein n=1 Tax=Rhinocladiella mackenziei CBS 650.93 TaxID=1442369 RepID=A0A0D2IC03_9EURO|nr:uncharacterized protein Z518_06896 [Rhinocladiella mackenziei CBS 650.93]KIX03344.1 hypothetical protein Z518_06896 [Rhinocladiella mackenziei CBS 650.93]
MITSVTQIIYLTIPADKDLTDSKLNAGNAWSQALDVIEQHVGFRRLYWGRSAEDMSQVQLHVARDQLAQHLDFLNSAQYPKFQKLLQPLLDPSTTLLVRHAFLQDFTPKCHALGKGAPFTGTAIYVSTNAAWHEGAWPLWTHIVRCVDGCLGCAGGTVVEPVDGHANSYIVYVGWESIEKHEAYHHTSHFAKRRVILGLGNKGYREYGHIKFEGSREAGTSRL